MTTSAPTGAYKRGRFDLFAVRPEATSFEHSRPAKPILLLSNHFKVLYDATSSFFMYYVNVTKVDGGGFDLQQPPTSSKAKAKREQTLRKVLDQLVQANSNPGGIFHGISCIYDGEACMYTSSRVQAIGDKIQKFQVTFANEWNDTFEICLKMVKVISLQAIGDYYQNPVNDAHIEAIRAINLVVRQIFLTTRFLVGRSYFHLSAPDDERSSLSALKEISFGVFSSVQAHASGLQLVLDRSCAPFLKPHTLDECIRASIRECGAQRWNEFVRRKLEGTLKDCMFEVTHLSKPRRYKLSGLTLEAAHQITFVSNQDNNREISVADYFRKTYFPLRWPDLACVKVRKAKNEFLYFPAEVCRIVVDQQAKKLTIKEKADMIRNVASVKPSDRFDIIRANARDLLVVDQKCHYLTDFGINISMEPIAIKARVLTPPRLLEANRQEVRQQDGKWNIRKFFKAANLNQWILVLMAKFDDSLIERFVSELMRAGRQLGMQVNLPKKIRYNFEKHSLSAFFAQTTQQFANIDLYFFLGCDMDLQYNSIKKVGDIEFGIPTQCMRQANVFRFNQSISINLLQKINIKLGGINVAPDLERMPPLVRNRRVMVVGADVAHPSSTERSYPSIAAMVANCNADFTHYSCSVKIQQYFRQEIIQHLESMLVEVMNAYETRMKMLPDTIVFYRDGVSEGQFKIVYDQEVQVIKETLAKYRPNYQPKLTFILVQKRHHTRFVPDDSRDGVGKSCNVPPGTVVDLQVVHPRNFDFFLCSHAGIQGTSRPSHYCVLTDENDFTAEEVQELTNTLCHLYSRCSRSISIPTPVYYAHLAAFRARTHIQAATDRMSFESDHRSSLTGDTNSRVHYTKHRVPEIHNFDSYIDVSPRMKCSMYFC